LRLPLSVRRKTLAWLNPEAPERFEPGRFPGFAFADRFFYGFPNSAGHGVKLAIHWGEGLAVVDPSLPVAPPGQDDLVPIVHLASQYLLGLTSGLADGLSRVQRAVTCLYTMTPDEHFIIDRHPSIENVWLAAGFSGHGFKFAPAIRSACRSVLGREHDRAD
jgi:glycine/D-amino acid oxidase-like deaminating enzyme